MSEQQPLLHSEDIDVESGQQTQAGRKPTSREWLAEKLESRNFHAAVIGLISIDSAIVLADLSYTFLSDSCISEDADQPMWLEILSQISLVITVVFLVELIAFVWAFGPRYYSPFQSVLHFCDGSVIVLTFVVEVILRGRERELASLLILFRLFRFAAEAAVGVGELNESTSKELEDVKAVLMEKERALDAAQKEIQMLRTKISNSNTVP